MVNKKYTEVDVGDIKLGSNFCAITFTSTVLQEIFNSSQPQFPHLKNGALFLELHGIYEMIYNIPNTDTHSTPKTFFNQFLNTNNCNKYHLQFTLYNFFPVYLLSLLISHR